MKAHTHTNHLDHFNFLFTGWGTHVYDRTMVPLARRLYQRVIEDIASLELVEGKVLDVGTGPGTLVRGIARRFPELEVYGVDLSEEMIRLAREHASAEQLGERVHFAVSDVADLPYPDHSFDLVVSTISMHHWHDLVGPLCDLHRVLRPGGRLWIYDFKWISRQTMEKALAFTPFGATPLEQQRERTGFLLFAPYQRFALQRGSSEAC